MKIKKIVSILGMLILTINITLSIVPYYFQNRDYYLTMIGGNYWKITSNKNYYSFVKHYEEEITKPASKKSKQEFDNFYNKSNPTTGWSDYSTLQTDLISTKLSPQVTLDLNWTNLFKQVNINDKKIKQGQIELLHFYNIIANLYNKDNILRLIQWARLDQKTESFGYIWNPYPFFEGQIMGMGTIFADQDVINKSYNYGFAATNALISTIVHEYGHALSTFLRLSPTLRKYFNERIVLPPSFFKNSSQNKKLLNLNYSNNKSNITASSIPECADLLTNYLNDKANIDTDQIKRTFFPLIVVRSNYGRSYWLKDIEDFKLKKNEFFAEAFDEWLDTPSNERTWNWELLNDFFIHKLPTYF